MLTAVARFCRDLVICLAFYSRVPIGGLAGRVGAWSMADFAKAAGLAPLAGLLLGCLPAATLAAARALDLPSSLAAGVAVAVLVAASGALHEDGLADVADGFGGGRTRDRKLEIMRDSRIGTFGAIALIIGLGLRIGAAAAVADRSGTGAAAAGFAGAAAASRGFGLIPLWALRPARPDGLARAVGRLPGRSMLLAAGLALLIGASMPLFGGLVAWRGVAAGTACAAAGWGVTAMAARHIGGQTGDVAGAAQQAGEIAYWLVLCLAPALG